MTTPRIEEILSNIEDIIQNYHGNWPDKDEMNEILGELRKAHQAGIDEAVELVEEYRKTADEHPEPTEVEWCCDDIIQALQDNKYKIN